MQRKSGVILIFVVSWCISGATYYVSNDGDDASQGTIDSPWKTMGYSMTNAVSGDTVIIKAGIYREFLTPQNSGTDGNPIVFQGERSGSEWLTIIDPSTDASTGWLAAPEIGDGVFKLESLPFETHEMTINNKRVAYVWTVGSMASAINSAYSASGLTTGVEFLTLPPTSTLVSNFNGNLVTFWDSVLALYSTDGGSTTYLRLRDGSNPNSLNIRIAPNTDGSETDDVRFPAWNIVNKSHITIKDFSMRGAFGGIVLNRSSHITVQNNRLAGGHTRIVIASASHSAITGNLLTTDYYGYNDPGAWQNGDANRENLYLVSKFLMGNHLINDYGVYSTDGVSNTITGNTFLNSIGDAVLLSGGLATVVSSNIVSGSSGHGVMLYPNQVDTAILCNTLSDNNVNIRFHMMDQIGETERLVYIYRNTLWQRLGIGEHIYVHFTQDETTYYPVIWTYHNSFSGGVAGVEMSGYAGYSGIPGCRFINNVFSGCQYMLTYASETWTDVSMVGSFDYNLVTPPSVTYPSILDPAWWGEHNIVAESAVWGTDTAYWGLPSSSLARDSALDVTQSFTLGETTYDALPATAERKVGDAWDMGAIEGFQGTSRSTTTRATTLRGR